MNTDTMFIVGILLGILLLGYLIWLIYVIDAERKVKYDLINELCDADRRKFIEFLKR